MTLCLSALAIGCGNRDDPPGAPPTPTPQAPQPDPLAEINAAIPPELRTALEFEWFDDERGRFRVAVPKGWNTSFMPGTYEPPEGSPYGAMTRYRVATNCDGACQPKDWAATAEKIEFKRFASAHKERDDRTDNSRLVVVRSGNRVDIAAAWWRASASRYYYCRASLTAVISAAANAFVKACQSMRVVDW